MIVVNKDHNDAYNISHVVNIYMASDDEVEREIKAGNKIHGISGKKQKGHGGS